MRPVYCNRKGQGRQKRPKRQIGRQPRPKPSQPFQGLGPQPAYPQEPLLSQAAPLGSSFSFTRPFHSCSPRCPLSILSGCPSLPLSSLVGIANSLKYPLPFSVGLGPLKEAFPALFSVRPQATSTNSLPPHHPETIDTRYGCGDSCYITRLRSLSPPGFLSWQYSCPMAQM